MRILIKNCSIITMIEPDDVYSVGQIEIEGDRIAYAGTVRDTDVKFDKVIDGSGMVALPGLINSHTHSSMSLMRGYGDDMPLMKWLKERIWPVEEGLTGEDVYWGAMLSIAEMLRSGTTAFADMYFFMEEVARAVSETGIRADLSIGMVSVSGDWKERIQNCKSFFSEWNGEAEGRINVSLGPHAPYTCVPDFLALVSDLAGELGAKIHIHLAETLDEVRQIKENYGKTPIEYARDAGLFEHRVLGAHCVHLTDDDMRIMKEYGVNAVHNPQSNMKLASGIAPVPAMLRAGLPVALGTDGASSNNNLDMIEEMRAASFLHKVNTMDPTVLPAYQGLEMATKNGAAVLGLDEEIGQIALGKKADIILVDFHKPHLCPRHDPAAHLVYAAQPSDVKTVIVDGKIIMEDRRVLTMDEEKVMYEAARCTKRLVSG